MKDEKLSANQKNERQRGKLTYVHGKLENVAHAAFINSYLLNSFNKKRGKKKLNSEI